MSTTRTSDARAAAIIVAAFLAIWPSQVGAQQVRLGPTDIGGVVTGAKGPEAGVWVIAETTGLGTQRYAKIVVTDDQGRYLLPALPSGAQYNVWVRGFGLVDSPRVHAKPGTTLNLTAAVAPTERAAAQYYSGSYWWSMLNIPDKRMFPGTGLKGNGMPIEHAEPGGLGGCRQAKRLRQLPPGRGPASCARLTVRPLGSVRRTRKRRGPRDCGRDRPAERWSAASQA